ncbi:hypothetical protein SmJEL517_g04480 [Synchytrium microbalum]|uniref:Uncharacterized protein n=1 Tax=Synchytrium microbalum TaxID=1806994 RepID=A0A507C314_9FUNG|nr:uncharacterized protein SmJEL517_g04480 [Synchytrium microbalum]TPX32474.1 hypothetical protein SmJEL517_g04480 [Synchytrium microbalum]
MSSEGTDKIALWIQLFKRESGVAHDLSAIIVELGNATQLEVDSSIDVDGIRKHIVNDEDFKVLLIDIKADQLCAYTDHECTILVPADSPVPRSTTSTNPLRIVRPATSFMQNINKETDMARQLEVINDHLDIYGFLNLQGMRHLELLKEGDILSVIIKQKHFDITITSSEKYILQTESLTFKSLGACLRKLANKKINNSWDLVKAADGRSLREVRRSFMHNFSSMVRRTLMNMDERIWSVGEDMHPKKISFTAYIDASDDDVKTLKVGNVLARCDYVNLVKGEQKVARLDQRSSVEIGLPISPRTREEPVAHETNSTGLLGVTARHVYESFLPEHDLTIHDSEFVGTPHDAFRSFGAGGYEDVGLLKLGAKTETVRKTTVQHVDCTHLVERVDDDDDGDDDEDSSDKLSSGGEGAEPDLTNNMDPQQMSVKALDCLNTSNP